MNWASKAKREEASPSYGNMDLPNLYAKQPHRDSAIFTSECASDHSRSFSKMVCLLFAFYNFAPFFFSITRIQAIDRPRLSRSERPVTRSLKRV